MYCNKKNNTAILGLKKMISTLRIDTIYFVESLKH